MIVRIYVSLFLSLLIAIGCGVKTTSSDEKSAEDGWITIMHAGHSLSLPPGLTLQDQTSVDSPFVEYGNGEMSVTAEGEVGSISLRQFENQEFVEKSTKHVSESSGIKRVQVDYVYRTDAPQIRDSRKRFGKAMGIDCEQVARGLVVVVTYVHPETEKIANRILSSIVANCD